MESLSIFRLLTTIGQQNDELRFLSEQETSHRKQVTETKEKKSCHSIWYVTTSPARRQGARVTDGPYTETKEHMGGFCILEAADLDEALTWAKKGAVACDIPGEVRELRFYPAPEQGPGGSK